MPGGRLEGRVPSGTAHPHHFDAANDTHIGGDPRGGKGQAEFKGRGGNRFKGLGAGALGAFPGAPRLRDKDQG